MHIGSDPRPFFFHCLAFFQYYFLFFQFSLIIKTSPCNQQCDHQPYSA